MDSVLHTIASVCKSRYRDDDDLVENIPGWLRNAWSLADKELDGEIVNTYYTALLAEMLSRGDEELEKHVLSCGLPTQLMKYLTVKILSETQACGDDLLVQEGPPGDTRATNAPTVAARAAAADTTGVVMTAAFEEYKKTNNEEALVFAAATASITATHDPNDVSLSSDSLEKLQKKSCFQCLVILHKYREVRALEIQKTGFKATLTKLIIEQGGIQMLLAIPRSAQTFLALSSCLLKICSIKEIMGCVCAIPLEVYHVVELALELLEHQHDLSRRYVAKFFYRAFAYRSVLNAFDGLYGLQKLLSLLHDVGLVISGAITGQLNNLRLLPNDGESKKILAYCTCQALERYFRAQLVQQVDLVRSYVRTPISSVRDAEEPLDVSDGAMDDIWHQIHKDREHSIALMLCAGWPIVGKFLDANGHITMLQLCQAPETEMYLYLMVKYALGVLYIVTLVPTSCNLITDATLRNGSDSVGVIVEAAKRARYFDNEISVAALKLLENLVCPLISMKYEVQSTSTLASELIGSSSISLGAGAGCAELSLQPEQGYRKARDAFLANQGINLLRSYLRPKEFVGVHDFDRIWALACQVLLGLARDDEVADMLRELLVRENLLELMKDRRIRIPCGGEWHAEREWQAERDRATVELFRVVANPRDAAISDEDGVQLQLYHLWLRKSGQEQTADILLRETRLMPLPLGTKQYTLDDHDALDDLLASEYS